MRLRGLALLLLGLAAACAPLPPGQSRDGRWQPSPNFDQRRPNFVILHQTSNDNVDKGAGDADRPATRRQHPLPDRPRRCGAPAGRRVRPRLACRRVLVGRQYRPQLGIHRHRTRQHRRGALRRAPDRRAAGPARRTARTPSHSCRQLSGPRRCRADAQGRSGPPVPLAPAGAAGFRPVVRDAAGSGPGRLRRAARAAGAGL
jgi:hypothetical protein